MQLFSNFAKAELGAPILTVDQTTVTLVATTGGLFTAPEGGDFEVAYLTDGTYYEIVHIIARTSDVLTVLRGQENTLKRTWGLGTTLMSGVTKGTMENMTQIEEHTPSSTIMNYMLFV